MMIISLIDIFKVKGSDLKIKSIFDFYKYCNFIVLYKFLSNMHCTFSVGLISVVVCTTTTGNITDSNSQNSYDRFYNNC